VLARLLAASGRKAEAQDELAQAIALFDQSKMTVYAERTKAAFSGFETQASPIAPSDHNLPQG
jgi:hypothetical protein